MALNSLRLSRLQVLADISCNHNMKPQVPISSCGTFTVDLNFSKYYQQRILTPNAASKTWGPKPQEKTHFGGRAYPHSRITFAQKTYSQQDSQLQNSSSKILNPNSTCRISVDCGLAEAGGLLQLKNETTENFQTFVFTLEARVSSLLHSKSSRCIKSISRRYQIKNSPPLDQGGKKFLPSHY